jgi:hypothetical protein
MHMQVGPRLDLELVKVQDGLASGSVLYHRYEQRSAGDVAAQEVARADAERLRAARRQEQEANVRRKAAERARAERAKQARDVLIWAMQPCAGRSREGTQTAQTLLAALSKVAQSCVDLIR